MNPKKNDQPINQTPTLQIDAATFQAAVSAAVLAVMTHLNANNASVSRIAINHSNPGNNPAPQRPTNYHGTPSAEAKSNTQKFWAKRKNKSLRGANKNTATTSAPPTTIPPGVPMVPTPAIQYAGNLPKCYECSFHHLGSCRPLHCYKCNRDGHTASYCRIQIQHISSTTNVQTSQLCHLCGVMGQFKRDCPTGKGNDESGGV
ncbi:hypothetical protein Lser_V15G29682 [Lactuca serriola]